MCDFDNDKNNLREESYEYGLPEYLQKDLDNFKKALAGEDGYYNLIHSSL